MAILDKRGELMGEVRDAIAEHVDAIERRYADKEAVRLAHIVRHALTPEQYYAAETAARAVHPEAWEGRHPIRTKGQEVTA
jgi:hypothetical protein